MVWYLVKRDALFKTALVWSLFLPLLTPSLLGTARFPRRLEATDARVWACGFFFYTAFLLALQLHRRSTHFEASLPITGRQLFAVRMPAILTVIWLPIAAATASWTARGTSDGRELSLAFVQAGTFITLAASLHPLICAPEAVVPWLVEFGYWALVVFVGGAALFLMPPALMLLLCAMASVVAFRLAWMAIPRAFQFAPVAAASDSKPARQAVSAAAWRPILRTAYPWLAILVFPAGFISGVVPTFSYLTLAVVFLAFMMNRLGTRWLQTSPLSRSALVHLGLAVAVAPYMVGAAMGMALRPNLPPPFFNSFVGGGPRLYRPANQDFPNTNLPLEFWRYAPGGNVPLIRAPWGESVQPQPLFIAGFAFFNPYEVRNGNGERFSDWQLGRATEAVHGRRLSRQQYQDFLGGFFGSDRFINWQAPRLPEVLGQPRMAILTLAFYLCGCLALVLLHELLQSYRLHRAGRLPLRMVAALAGMPFLTAFVLDEYYLLRRSTAVAGPLFKMFLLHLSDRMPRNLYEVGALSAVPAILLYLIVRRQFARSEMTVRLVRALPGITFPGAS